MSFGTTETVRVHPWGERQGNYVEIDKSEYEANKKNYKLYDGPDNPVPEVIDETPAPKTAAELRLELEEAEKREAAEAEAAKDKAPGEGWGGTGEGANSAAKDAK